MPLEALHPLPIPLGASASSASSTLLLEASRNITICRFTGTWSNLIVLTNTDPTETTL
jgi:hypothetical protein